MQRSVPAPVAFWHRTHLLAAPLLILWLTLAGPAVASEPPATAASEPAAASEPLAVLAARFEEPLVATGATTPEEDAALAAAITARPDAAVDDLTPLEDFVTTHPASPWRLAVLTNLGLSYYHFGYFSKAIDAFERAWAAGREATDRQATALADRAVGELLELHASLGHSQELAALLDTVSDRPLSGPATELRAQAKKGLWTMRSNPGISFLCGPMALKQLLISRGASAADVAFIDAFRSGPQGVTLAEVGRLADQAKLPHRLIHRAADEPIPVPSIVHWKVNHYAAIVAEREGRYQVIDPTFGNQSLWVTRGALDSETSGFFLVPTDTTPAPQSAWREATAAEAGGLYGMGVKTGDTNTNPTNTTPPAQDPCPPGQGMCQYNFSEMQVSLHLFDRPVGYTPPKGPAPTIEIAYNQREVAQPANFSFFNVSPKWTLNWLSYIKDDPTLVGSQVSRYAGGGGAIAYTYDSTTKSFMLQADDSSQLELTSRRPVVYQRRLRNGSVETYSAPNGATTYPRLVFLTRISDATGNAISLKYDARHRLTELIDATGRATTFSYGLTKAPLLVTRITDPFGRGAALAYDGSGRLSQITDVIGLTSKFTYDAASLVNSLTTAYGTTTFAYGDTDPNNGGPRYLQATDPLGQTERLEDKQQLPQIAFSDPANTVPPGIVAPFNQYLNDRVTFYWDKHAYAVAAGDYTRARIRHWLHDATNTSLMTDVLESVKYPLENRIWYNYPGQSTAGLGAGQTGTSTEPTNIARVLDDGGQQLTQAQYNPLGNITSVIDPVGRATSYRYAANQIDVTAVQQATASGAVTTGSFTYNAQHLPLTVTDAAGKVTHFAYNAAGQMTKTTNALGQVTSLAYNALGYLTGVTNANGKTAASFTYDAAGHVATATDSEGWTEGFAYDALDRVTKESFPDGTSRGFTYAKLDLVSVKDRQGRVISYAYDAVRQRISETDPLGHVTKYGYYENGALKTLTDPDRHVTSWAIDLEGRVTSKQYADGRVFGYGYEHSDSRLLFVSDPLNQVKQFSYTPDDRLTGATFYNPVHPTAAIGFTYDRYFPRLTAMTDGSGTTTYGYGPVGALGALHLTGEKSPYANTAIGYTYDALGRVVGRAVGGDAESFGYDAIGRLVTHVDDLGDFARTYLGQTRQLTGQSNGHVRTTWSYAGNTGDRRLSGIANGAGASAYSFTTTPEYDITGIVDTFNKRTWTYSYDLADRLLAATATGGPKYAYADDPAGNLDKITRPSGTTTVTANDVNAIVKTNATGFAYDADGNLLRDATRSYTWDADNRLTAIGYHAHPTWQTTFAYDGMGRRIAIGHKTGAIGGVTRYLWCGQTMCQARSSKDVVTKRYFPEGEATPAANLKLYYAVDQIGSVRDAVGAGTNTHVAHFDYEPYGAQSNAQQSTTTDFAFAGLFREPQSGLYLATHRAYDPVLGRWVSRDPIGEAGGVNLYAYVKDNPTSATDRLGLEGCGCGGGGGGGGNGGGNNGGGPPPDVPGGVNGLIGGGAGVLGGAAGAGVNTGTGLGVTLTYGELGLGSALTGGTLLPSAGILGAGFAGGYGIGSGLVQLFPGLGHLYDPFVPDYNPPETYCPPGYTPGITGAIPPSAGNSPLFQ